MVPFSYWSVLLNSRTFHAHVPVQVVLFSCLLACVFILHVGPQYLTLRLVFLTQNVLVNVCCGAQMQNKIEMFVKQWLKVWLAGNKLENYHVHVHVLNTFAKAIYVIQLNFQES